MLDDTLDATVIVWKTKRPIIDMPELNEDPLLQPDLRSSFLWCPPKAAHQHQHIRATSSNTVFWDWIDNVASHDELLDLFLHIQKALPACNGFIAAFNPIAALCTGSHNNASPLGSLGQAKSALFYLIPCQGNDQISPHGVSHTA